MEDKRYPSPVGLLENPVPGRCPHLQGNAAHVERLFQKIEKCLRVAVPGGAVRYGDLTALGNQ